MEDAEGSVAEAVTYAVVTTLCSKGESAISNDAKMVAARLANHVLMLGADDIIAFAQHAKRQTITTEDVKILARRNGSLLKALEEYETKRREGEKKNVAKAGDGGEAFGRDVDDSDSDESTMSFR